MTVMAEVLQAISFQELTTPQFLALATSLQALWGQASAVQPSSCMLQLQMAVVLVCWRECGVWIVPGAGVAGVGVAACARRQQGRI